MANALEKVRAEAAISSARHSGALARLRAKNAAAMDRMRSRMKEAKAAERAGIAGAMVVANLGGVVSGQFAKPDVFVNTSTGKARGHFVNYFAGGAAFLLILGSRPTMGKVAVAAGLNGMLTGQLAIDSKEKWNLNPFKKADQP